MGTRLLAAAETALRELVGEVDLVTPNLPELAVLVDADGGVVEFISRWVVTRNTHGTGCSLSSAVVTVMASTGDWVGAVRRGKDWLQEALIHADGSQVGQGNGPINYFHQLWTTAQTLQSGQDSSTS